MRIAEDVRRVMDSVRKSVDAKGNINLPNVLREVMLLFERIKILLPATNAEERKELFQTMAEMHGFLVSEVKRLAEKTGLPEHQMLLYADNPDNFTKEQWALLSEVKNKMGQQAQEIREVMKGLPPVEIAAQVGEPSKVKVPRARAKKGGKKVSRMQA